MIAIVFLGIITLILLIAVTTAILSKEDDIKFSAIATSVVMFVIGFIVFAITSISVVPARTVGIVTEFGKAVGTVDAGFHWLTPWSEVTEFPTSNQPLDLDATDQTGEAVQVKFDGGGTGFVNINIVWQVENGEKAVDLWNNWREFDKVQDMVVKPNAISVVGQVVGSYEPREAAKSENYVPIANDVKRDLAAALSQYGINVENVAVKRIDLDELAQRKINDQLASVENKTIAEKDQETARVQAETDRIRQSSLTPGALQAKCLEVTAAWDVAKNGPLPANWNCSSPEGLALAVPVK